MSRINNESLEELREKMMVNNSAEFEIHYDVTIKLIEIVHDQNEEIEGLRRQLFGVSNAIQSIREEGK